MARRRAALIAVSRGVNEQAEEEQVVVEDIARCSSFLRRYEARRTVVRRHCLGARRGVSGLVPVVAGYVVVLQRACSEPEAEEAHEVRRVRVCVALPVQAMLRRGGSILPSVEVSGYGCPGNLLRITRISSNLFLVPCARNRGCGKLEGGRA